jgi:peptidoglycan/xylan/chitin deacetylase (PgdA/CDA1 family)
MLVTQHPYRDPLNQVSKASVISDDLGNWTKRKPSVKKRAIVLMYHNIGIPPAGKNALGLNVSPRMFRFQMWYLKTTDFKVVPLKDIGYFIHGGCTHDKLVAITFDDGYQDFFDNAYPILGAYNFSSTVFIVADLVGEENARDF